MSTSVLFDAPGPRARARYRLAGTIGAVLTLGIVAAALWKFAQLGQLDGAKWQPFTRPELWTQYLLPGLRNTLLAAAVSIALAFVLGLLLGLGRLSHVAWIRVPVSSFVEFFRAVPVLIMMYFAYQIFIQFPDLPGDFKPLLGVIVGLTFYNSCVLAELVRSGVHALPKGQNEAGLSIGLTRWQSLTRVLLPQALTAMLPGIVGQLVIVLKDSALGTAITYPELLNQANTAASNYSNYVPMLFVAAVIFIAINYALTVLAHRIERRLLGRGRAVVHPAEAGAGTVGVVAVDDVAHDQVMLGDQHHH